MCRKHRGWWPNQTGCGGSRGEGFVRHRGGRCSGSGGGWRGASRSEGIWWLPVETEAPRGVKGRRAVATGSICVRESKRSHEETRASGIRHKQPGVTETHSRSRRRRPNRAATHIRDTFTGVSVLWTKQSSPRERGGNRGSDAAKGVPKLGDLALNRVRVSSGGVGISAHAGAH
jgi:hypothetical protein